MKGGFPKGGRERINRKTFKYRMYPTKRQRRFLEQTLELCRWVYNETLAVRKGAWEKDRKSLSRYDTINMLPSWKEHKPELVGVHSQVLQDVCKRVGRPSQYVQDV